MNDHSKFAESLPLYVSGALDKTQRQDMERHLKNCPACRSDLALWQGVSRQIGDANRGVAAPPALADRALARLPAHTPNAFGRAYALVRAQAPLVRGEMWLASAAVMALGVIVTTIVKDVAAVRMLAPMVAAASISVIYGPENDPALEMTLATAVSPWKILLARLTLVFSYNVALALAASLGVLALLPADIVGNLILDWLGPMAFLSAGALVLSLILGTGNAILVTYLVWLARFVPGSDLARTFHFDLNLLDSFLTSYRQFWSSPLLLVALATALVVLAGWLADRQEKNLPRLA